MKPTFLVLTDLSAAARRAAHFTGLLAAAVGGQLVLLYQKNAALFEPDMSMVTLPEDYYTQEKHDTDVAMAELARALPAPASVATGGASLYDVLGDLIGLWQPQLLAMALAPEHDVLDHLLVNQALPVLRDSGLPLLLVPNGAAQNPALPKVVAIAADGEAFRLSAASLALGPLLDSWAADYCVVHVAPPDAPNDPGLRLAEASVRRSGLLPAAPCTTYEVRRQPRSAGLVQAAADVQADVLVLMVRPRSLLASVFGRGVAAHVAHACPVPQLLLPTVEIPDSQPEQTPQHAGTLLY